MARRSSLSKPAVSGRISHSGGDFNRSILNPVVLSRLILPQLHKPLIFKVVRTRGLEPPQGCPY